MFACEHLVKKPDQTAHRWLIYWFCEDCWKGIQEGKLETKIYAWKEGIDTGIRLKKINNTKVLIKPNK